MKAGEETDFFNNTIEIFYNERKINKGIFQTAGYNG